MEVWGYAWKESASILSDRVWVWFIEVREEDPQVLRGELEAGKWQASVSRLWGRRVWGACGWRWGGASQRWVVPPARRGSSWEGVTDLEKRGYGASALPGKGLDGVGGAAGWGLLLLALPRGAGELAGGRGRGRRRWAPAAGPQ